MKDGRNKYRITVEDWGKWKFEERFRKLFQNEKRKWKIKWKKPIHKGDRRLRTLLSSRDENHSTILVDGVLKIERDFRSVSYALIPFLITKNDIKNGIILSNAIKKEFFFFSQTIFRNQSIAAPLEDGTWKMSVENISYLFSHLKYGWWGQEYFFTYLRTMNEWQIKIKKKYRE